MIFCEFMCWILCIAKTYVCSFDGCIDRKEVQVLCGGEIIILATYYSQIYT